MYQKFLSTLTRCTVPGIVCAILWCAEPAAAGTMTLQVEAHIDGQDQLIVRDNELQWAHFSFAAVGRLGGGNRPTIISTWLDGVPAMDRFEWVPEWSAPPPDQIRQAELSSVFSGLQPAVLLPMNTQLEIVDARGTLSLSQLPAVENAYSTVLDFNDNGPVGAAWYVARLNFEVVPEPAGLVLWVVAALIVVPIVICTRMTHPLPPSSAQP